jgi:hypothetical protein
MRRTIALALLVLTAAACHPKVSPEVVREWQSRALFTCCNIRYEGGSVTDANYVAGGILPFGSPVTIESMTNDSVTFASGATHLTLTHSYGTQQESAQQYFDKILVSTDPHVRFAAYPKDVQDAITDGRVEVGMTKEQVIMSIGYPPTHRTASTDLNTWVYWYNRWVTYQVQFGADGKVTGFVGNAPTRNQPIVAKPAAAPPVRAIRRKGK